MKHWLTRYAYARELGMGLWMSARFALRLLRLYPEAKQGQWQRI